MKIIKEFKEFAIKGNALELAVGVIIGGAFGKIITSLVNDIVMPPLGILIGGINFSALKFTLKAAEHDLSGKTIHDAIALNYGNFLQSLIDFVIIAVSIFLMIKAVNAFRRRQEHDAVKAAPISKEVELLAEIRDLLKK